MPGKIYTFDNFTLDTRRAELRRRDEIVHVEPLVFGLLTFLCENPGRVVSRDEIIEAVWNGRFVSDTAVSGGIKFARKALDDSGDAQRFIKTVRGRGFLFAPDVNSNHPTAEGPAGQIEVLSGPSPLSTPPSEQYDVIGNQPSIAVLPFQLLTQVDQHGHLGDAVAQEIILELSRLHWLLVIARGSSFVFREPEVDVRLVSQRLNVRYVLAGTLSIQDQTSIVDVELVQGSDGHVIWAERFEQSLGDLLILKSTIAANIVGVIEARIRSTEVMKARRLSTEALDAWSAYHQGLWHMFRFSKSDNSAASEFFTRAISQDSQFARAHAGLSFTHFQNAFLNFTGQRDAEIRLARSHAEKGYELDPFDPFVNLTVGRSLWIANNLDAALPWLDRSIELSPNFAFALYNRALLGLLCDDAEQSEGQSEKALALSPIDPLSYAMMGTRAWANMIQGNWDVAADWATRAARVPNAHFHIDAIAAIAHLQNGQKEQAAAYIRNVLSSQSKFNQADFFRAFPFANAEFRNLVASALSTLGVD
ncbi:MAG: winged helix-turn-helix domain-containing tetratricopeptide repeat protein [Hyphomicrobiaceae bacterium]